MQDSKGKAVLLRLKRTWMYQRLLIGLLLALAFSIAAATVFQAFFSINFYWVVSILVFLYIVFNLINQWWKISEWDVARFLNQRESSLQESAELVLHPSEKLSLLQRLQQQRIEEQLTRLPSPHPLRKKIGMALAFLGLVMLVCGAVVYFPIHSLLPQRSALITSSVVSKKQTLPATIKSLSIIVSPPVYTGITARRQDKFDIQIEEGGSVTWMIETTSSPKVVQLIFNDGTILLLQSTNKLRTTFRAQKNISKPGFYQLKLGDTLSELYKIEVIKDKAPTVTIQTPKPATTVSFGRSQIIPLQATVADDYGIQSASISATVSSGQGEAVKFKQQTLAFNNFAAGQRQNVLQKSLDLKALGMEPGNELYFFITATDTRHQEVRSDVYLITLEDTTVESSMDGMVNGLDVKPDLFRSERQIIIETEQLLQDRAKISVEAFQKKSDDLGIDQKLLRLRYGKFLGEETDTEIGGHEHHDEHNNAGVTDGATEILEQYGHAHDNAEDATFFDAATKKQLKETLAEMWKAELQLRTFKPKDALVFEYKALRLLKDLQQKSRAYVAKTGFTTTPLKMEKRLTGELTKIGQPIMQQQFEKAVLPEIAARKAISELEQLKQVGLLQPAQKAVLQQAFQQLSTKAAQAPSLYLPALSALRKVLSENFSLFDINAVENGLQQMLSKPAQLPTAATVISSKNLSTRYFINLSGGRSHK